MAEELRRTGKKKLLRRLTRVLVTVIILLASVHLFLLFAISPVLGEILKNSISKASKQHYSIEYSKLNFNILTRSVKINNLVLKPDTARFAQSKLNGTAPLTMLEAEVQQLQIKNIDIWKAWRGKEIIASEIILRSPKIILNRNLNEVRDTATLQLNPNDLLPEGYNGLYVHKITLQNGEVSLKLISDKPTTTPLKIENIWVNLTDFHIDSTTINSSAKLFSTDHLELKVRDYTTLLTDSVHRLTVNEIHILKDNISLNNVELKPDSIQLKTKKLPAFSYTAAIPKIVLSTVNFYEILDSKDIQIESIKIQQPQLKLTGKNSKNKQKQETAFDLAKLLPKTYSSLLVNLITVDQGKLSWIESSKTHPLTVNTYDVRIAGLFIDTATAAQDNRLLYTDTIAVTLKSINYNLPDNKYNLNIPGITYNSATRYLQINNINFGARKSREAFFKNEKHQTDWIKVSLNSIQVSGLNAIELIRQSKFIASQVNINNMTGNVFRDKRLPPKPGHAPPMPQQMLKNLPLIVNISTVKIRNANITYEEHSPKAKVPGVATLKNLHATINNVTNDPALLAKNIPLKVSMQANLMGTGVLKANLNMPLGDARGRFSVNASLGTMAFSDLNSMMEPAMGLRILQGTIEKMDYTATADNNIAHGTMRFYYKDLKVQLTDQETGKANGLKESVASLIANTLIIQSDNPRNKQPLRIGIIKFERDKSKSFINYGWNMTLSGIISSLGVPENMQEKQQEKKIKKEEKLEQKELKKEERKEKREDKKEGRIDDRIDRRELRQQKKNSNTTADYDSSGN